MAVTTWPAADVSPAEAADLPVTAIAIATDGSPAAVERARTVIDTERVGPFDSADG